MYKRSEWTFLQRGYKMANKHMKRNLTLLVIRKMQVKTTIRYNFTFTRISKTITNADKDVKK